MVVVTPPSISSPIPPVEVRDSNMWCPIEDVLNGLTGKWSGAAASDIVDRPEGRPGKIEVRA
jgi:DNA-binding HxlR family transcriptional regulator